MKKFLIILTVLAFSVSCQKEIIDPVEDISFSMPINNHSSSADLQQLLEKYKSKGLVGISAVVDDPINGFWAGASGKASIESNTSMTKYHLHRSGSIPKMYTGTAIMLLKEQGLIELDSKMNRYLPSNICDNISNGNIITIRQLLTHSSGVYDYTGNPQLYFDQLNNAGGLNHTPLQLIEFIYGKPSQFNPGENTYYSNSNFLLLAVVIDFVIGESHAQYLKEQMFDPNSLEQTYYKIQSGYPNPPGIVNAYADWNANGKLINISDIYNYWEIMVGDDGMVASVYDYNRFTKLLFKGNIVSQTSLDEMMVWEDFDENDGQLTKTGLSIQYWQSNDGTTWGMGHRGATHGTGGYTYYFPSNQTTITIFTNTGCERGIYGNLLNDLWNEMVELAIN